MTPNGRPPRRGDAATRASPLIELLAAYRERRTDFPFSRIAASHLPWALECGLGPVIARCCAADPDAPTSPHWSAVVAADLAARVVAEDQAQATVDLLEACRPRVGTLTLLKGIWLSHGLHPEPHLRPMRDVDVLVEPDAVKEVERTLIDLGYEPMSPDGAQQFRDLHQLEPYRHPATDVVIEVHRALVPVNGPYASDPSLAPSSVRAHLRPATFRGQPAYRLSNELQILHVSVHWAGSLNVVGGGGGLVVMMDLPALLREVDWDAVVGLLSSPASASAAMLILSYLQGRGLADLDPWVLPAIERRQRAFGRVNLAILHALIDRRLVEGRPFGRVLLTSRQFDAVWLRLLNPRPAFVNLLSLPWSLLPVRWRIAATPFARPFARALGVEMRDLDLDR
jgi:hypothetical protein